MNLSIKLNFIISKAPSTSAATPNTASNEHDITSAVDDDDVIHCDVMNADVINQDEDDASSSSSSSSSNEDNSTMVKLQ